MVQPGLCRTLPFQAHGEPAQVDRLALTEQVCRQTCPRYEGAKIHTGIRGTLRTVLPYMPWVGGAQAIKAYKQHSMHIAGLGARSKNQK